MRVRLSAIAATLLAVSCSSTPKDVAPDRNAGPSDPTLETCDFLSGIRTRSELESAFGTPLSDEVTSIPNTHVAGASDELHTVRFEAVEAVYLVSETASRPILLGHSRIHKPLDKARLLQLVGEPVEAAQDLLGSPSSKQGDGLVYGCSLEAISTIYLEVDDGRVSAVVWQPYTG